MMYEIDVKFDLIILTFCQNFKCHNDDVIFMTLFQYHLLVIISTFYVIIMSDNNYDFFSQHLNFFFIS